MLGSVMMQGFFRAAMITRIALLIARQTACTQAHRRIKRLFVNAGQLAGRPERTGTAKQQGINDDGFRCIHQRGAFSADGVVTQTRIRLRDQAIATDKNRTCSTVVNPLRKSQARSGASPGKWMKIAFSAQLPMQSRHSVQRDRVFPSARLAGVMA